MRKLSYYFILVTLLACLGSTSVLAAGIAGTPHDLSAANYGTDQICIFCHTPHNAKVAIPLWNRENAKTDFQVYKGSSTLDGVPSDDLTGTVTLMCLSCHDGVTALNSYGNYDPGAGAVLMTGTAAIGLDAINSLTDDHPVNITYDTVNDKGLKDPTNCQLFKDAADQDTVQCGSCHAVHDNTNGSFLRMANTGSALCLDCHDK